VLCGWCACLQEMGALVEGEAEPGDQEREHDADVEQIDQAVEWVAAESSMRPWRPSPVRRFIYPSPVAALDGSLGAGGRDDDSPWRRWPGLPSAGTGTPDTGMICAATRGSKKDVSIFAKGQYRRISF
jgi:hypothetical protein